MPGWHSYVGDCPECNQQIDKNYKCWNSRCSRGKANIAVTGTIEQQQERGRKARLAKEKAQKEARDKKKKNGK